MCSPCATPEQSYSSASGGPTTSIADLAARRGERGPVAGTRPPCSEELEEALHARRREDDEEAGRRVADVAPNVVQTAGDEDEGSARCRVQIRSETELEVALEDVDELVLVRVQVARRTLACGKRGLHDRHAPAGLGCPRFERDRATEGVHERLALAGTEHDCVRLVAHSNGGTSSTATVKRGSSCHAQ
jgi:hypothetical protein